MAKSESISPELREIEETLRYLRDLIVVAKDAIKSSEKAAERIEEQLNIIRMKR